MINRLEFRILHSTTPWPPVLSRLARDRSPVVASAGWPASKRRLAGDKSFRPRARRGVQGSRRRRAQRERSPGRRAVVVADLYRFTHADPGRTN
jgi:hypothetical protein